MIMEARDALFKVPSETHGIDIMSESPVIKGMLTKVMLTI